MSRDQDQRRNRHRVPRILRFPLRLISAALIIALALTILPRMTRLVGRIWPDPSRTERVSEVIRHELTESARLETTVVDDEGVLTSTVQAALIGEVQRVTIDYVYHASIGVDLAKAEVQTEGGVVTVKLPAPELLSDSLTPTNVDRQDFWYPLTEKRRAELLEEERANRAEAALEEVRNSEELRKKTERTLQNMIRSWMGADTWLVTVQIEQQPDSHT